MDLKPDSDDFTAPPRRTLIFGSPPNPNGDLHVGHLAGPYLAADVFARHHRRLGEEVCYMVGTDDNQVWTATRAAEIGMEPQEMADHFAAEIAATLESTRLDVDTFFRPNALPGYRELVDEVIAGLYRDGHLVAREAPALWCGTCDRYLFEAWVSGTCPHCGKGSCGNGCEECCLPNDCVDLGDPVCKICGSTPSVRPVRRLYFPLEPHRDLLGDYHRTTVMSSWHRALCRRLFDGPLPEIVVSHVSDWGLPLPFDGFEGQRLSAWVEMAPGYLAASRARSEHGDGWRTFWASPNSRVVQFFGVDNGWCHGVLFPALLRAWDPEIRLPEGFVINHFYRLDGEKFSTSRGHAVWARDLVEGSSADAVRFYTCADRPATESTNFTLDAFRDLVERELCGRWQGWLVDLDGRMAADWDRTVPEAGSRTDPHRAWLESVRDVLVAADRAFRLEAFSPRRLTELARELVAGARDFARAEAARASVGPTRDEHRTGIALELLAARSLALLTAPLMPDFAGRLWRALGYDDDITDVPWETVPRFVPPGQTVSGLDEELFPAPRVGTASVRSGDGE